MPHLLRSLLFGALAALLVLGPLGCGSDPTMPTNPNPPKGGPIGVDGPGKDKGGKGIGLPVKPPK